MFMPAKKVQTYFGVPIPPFKENKLGAGSTTIRFVIKGKIPSKKNNASSVAVRAEARKFIEKLPGATISKAQAQLAIGKVYSKMVGNKEYKAFLERYKPIIQSQMQEWSTRLRDKGLIFPIPKSSLSLRLYFDNRYLTDTVNKQQTIQDLLVTCGVIPDDNYNRLNPIHSASACYVDELAYSIAFISISFKL